MLNILEIIIWFVAGVVLAAYSILFIINLGDLWLSFLCLAFAYGSIFMAYRRSIFIQ